MHLLPFEFNPSKSVDRATGGGALLTWVVHPSGVTCSPAQRENCAGGQRGDGREEAVRVDWLLVAGWTSEDVCIDPHRTSCLANRLLQQNQRWGHCIQAVGRTNWDSPGCHRWPPLGAGSCVSNSSPLEVQFDSFVVLLHLCQPLL